MKKAIVIVIAAIIAVSAALPCAPGALAENIGGAALTEEFILDERVSVQRASGATSKTNEELYSDSIYRYPSVVRTETFVNPDNTLSILTYGPRDGVTGIWISTYDSELTLIGTKKIEPELSLYGGFYCGEKYNFLVFGQKNEEEDNAKEVIRVVKYDKTWKRITSCAVRNCNIAVPFDASTVRMVENGNRLMIRTGRTQYKNSKGVNHQLQITVIVDTDTMADVDFLNSKDPQMYHHVSHSFNQFGHWEGENVVTVDLGDANPRSIVLNTGEKLCDRKGNYGYLYRAHTVFKIPGGYGKNVTGIKLGGFELSRDKYFITANAVDFSRLTNKNFGYFEIEGLEVEEREPVLYVVDKSDYSVEEIHLMSYYDTGFSASEPKLIKINDDRFLVMWEEYRMVENTAYLAESYGLRYAFIDGRGKLIGDICFAPGAEIGQDDTPIIWNGCAVWSVDDGERRRYYRDTPYDERSIYRLRVDSTLSAPCSESGKCADSRAYPVKGGNIYFDEKTGTVTGADIEITTARIPAAINGVEVKAIAKNAFRGCSEMKTVTLPYTITSMGDGAFMGCRTLVTVVLSEKLPIIPSFAFFGCESLESIYLPDSVEYVSMRAFSACVSLYAVSFPKEIKGTGKWSFSGGHVKYCFFSGGYAGRDRIIGLHAPGLSCTEWVSRLRELPSTWAIEPLVEAYKNKVIGDYWFKIVPESKGYSIKITRAECCEILMELLEAHTNAKILDLLTDLGLEFGDDTEFNDTGSLIYYAKYCISGLYKLGIVKGVGNGKFNPNGTLTRAEMAALLNRTAEYLGVDTSGYTHSFTDAAGHWSDKELGWPSSVGIIKGVGDEKFAPNKTLTLEQAIVIIYRAYVALEPYRQQNEA